MHTGAILRCKLNQLFLAGGRVAAHGVGIVRFKGATDGLVSFRPMDHGFERYQSFVLVRIVQDLEIPMLIGTAI